ncbi:sensor histidine kinase [Pseudomonas rubra]|uniref:histidine kinase n=1 Tax=Pseudomonas rubra TaxID=2942627 RepID=A0ABT5P1D9_9PSED|nr:HAMP domain-containing sensor histidine kinase [Pseudomonas rubra]MDD1012087.1 HAMP domain-containing histidine kinase [Pseudomonas rubra]MDD1038477.1 HAMP domain-containing histidine kinase [Pseudomonas rubra]MDD1153514.1 HAMP domain-containing histidine kinase [Pseudomonas rubra]
MLYPTKSFFARALYTLLPFTVIVAVLYSLLIWTSITVTEDHIVNSYLDREVTRFQQNHARAPKQAQLPATSYLRSYWSNDQKLPADYRNLPLGRHELDDERTHVQVIYLPAAGQNLYIELDESQLSSLDRHANLLFSILWGVAGLVIIAGALLAVIGARHLAAPVTQLADAVNRGWQPGTQLPGHERRDEVGTLSRALSQLVERLHDALERERAFTRHTSHELRTPLAVMRNSLAVLRLPGCSEEKRARNLTRLEQASGEMETMVQLFLYLGREDERLPAQAVALRPLLEACEHKHAQLIASKRQCIVMQVDPRLSIEAPPSVLQVLVNNLLGNALQHGAHYLHIEAQASHLQLVNGMDGNCAASSGFGYGLDIVQRLCTYCGWHLTTRQETERFIARVDFHRA